MPVAIEPAACAAHVERLRAAVDVALAEIATPPEPAALYDPVRYVLASGGKRLRPVMLLLAAEASGATPAQAMPAALAVEVFHNFTLVHDDIMDRAEERRGKPTVHVRWDVDTALLCGDFLLGLAYDVLARTPTDRLPRLMRTFGAMVVRLCEGQALDKAFETRPEVSVEEYLNMIDGKTGALLRATFELGGLVGGAEEANLATLRGIGADVGRAFQIQDDLLDLVADDARWGKSVGRDLIEGKKTLLLLRTLERAEGDEHAWFARIVTEGGLPPAEVPDARRRMERLGVLGEARAAVVRHTDDALAGLGALPPGPAAETLTWLVRRMAARLH